MNNSDDLLFSFPRRLIGLEKELLFLILPENKSGYSLYRNKIEQMYVIASGRSGGKNFILGHESLEYDISFGTAPVFASGWARTSNNQFDIIIHEEINGFIEFDISIDKDILNIEDYEITEKWSFSDWVPGNKAPGSNTLVKEIPFDNYVFAAAPEIKRIWVFEKESGVNYLIPIGNFYNNLMIIKNIRDPKIVLNPNLFFKDLADYKESDIIRAFVNYNKQIKRIDLDYEKLISGDDPNKKLFRRGAS